MTKAVSINTIRKLSSGASHHQNVAIRIVTFDIYGRGCSDMQFLPSSVVREYDRLTKLGYSVGLIDVGPAWRLPAIAA